MNYEQSKTVATTLITVMLFAAFGFLFYQLGRLDVRDSCDEHNRARVMGSAMVCSVVERGGE